MSSSEFSQENGSSSNDSVTLTDEAERHLSCYIKKSKEIDGSEYFLLVPVDSPVEIVAWDEEEEEDLADATLLEDDDEIDLIFPVAQAVLAEQNLTLKRTAFTLTVSGELPPIDENDLLTIEIEEEALEEDELEPEQFQLLSVFYHEEQEYGIYAPLTPQLFFARRDEANQLELLSPEEFEKVQPQLEELLLDELEED